MRWKLWTAVQATAACLPLFWAVGVELKRRNGACVPYCFAEDCSKAACSCALESNELFCESCQSRIRLPSVQYNYSRKLRFGWLVDGLSSNHSRVHIRVENFENECQLDSLHVFNGDGVYSERLFSLFGSLTRIASLVKREFVAKSGQAYVYLHSGLACSMAGLNVSYRFDSCTDNCNGNGVCDPTTGRCKCFRGSGPSCSVVTCSQVCARSARKSRKSDGDGECKCEESHPGELFWKVVNDGAPYGLASHAMCIVRETLWVIGGWSFSPPKRLIVMKHHLNNNTWSQVNTTGLPLNRYGHTVVEFGNNLYVYGGLVGSGDISNELWKLDLQTLVWNQLTILQDIYLSLPTHTMGHTAHVIGNTMLTFMGFNQLRGFVNTVQEYNFSSSTWRAVESTGAIPPGTYGHSSVYDPVTQALYFYGGLRAFSGRKADMVDDLYRYDPVKRRWKLLSSSGFPSFLHSAAIISGIMVVMNGHAKEQSNSKCGKYIIDSVLTYDIGCGTWSKLKSPDYLNNTLSRYGHRVVVYEKMMYVFGGFSGTFMKDLLVFRPGNCNYNRPTEECLNSQQGVKCVIDKNRCRSLEDALQRTEVEKRGPETIETVCSYKSVGRSVDCTMISDCSTCTSVEAQSCRWCGDSCASDCSFQEIKKPELCPESVNCSLFHNCLACESQRPQCTWRFNEHTCKDTVIADKSGNKKPTNEVVRGAEDVSVCLPCSVIDSCTECTENGCFWCATTQHCFDQNALMIFCSYGQCIQWTSSSDECSMLDCSSVLTCDSCLTAGPNCGWCDDGSGTGLGHCIRGSANGPVSWNDDRNSFETNSNLCPLSRWYIDSCPACQCNGHGHCSNETIESESSSQLKCLSCSHKTRGPHCERCMEGYYGNALNGGNCTICECNGQATRCDPFNGQCFCTTKGVSGYNCDKCEQKYIGDPRNQTCFYELTVDFVFTFNLNGEDDAHITRINFVTRPPKENTDVSFKLTCTGLLNAQGKVNLTVFSGAFGTNKLRRFLIGTACHEVERRFSAEEFSFGTDANTTFFVFLYDFKTPMIVQISFAQTPSVDWMKFFITFALCFFILLVVAFALWKIKQRLDLYRRRQRLFVEMAQMASRPFGVVQLHLSQDPSQPKTNVAGQCLRPPISQNKKPIAIEPCNDYRAAVVTFAVRLPTGGQRYTPYGQSGLAVASALCTLTPGQRAQLQTPPPVVQRKRKLKRPSCLFSSSRSS